VKGWHRLFGGALQGREEGSKLPAADATEGPAILVFNAILNFGCATANRRKPGVHHTARQSRDREGAHG